MQVPQIQGKQRGESTELSRPGWQPSWFSGYSLASATIFVTTASKALLQAPPRDSSGLFGLEPLLHI